MNKIEKISEILHRFDDDFQFRPDMLGSPEQVNSMFFHLDLIRFALAGEERYDDFDMSWIGFLIAKKYIVGASNHLFDGIDGSEDRFALLKNLRAEYMAWRKDISGHAR